MCVNTSSQDSSREASDRPQKMKTHFGDDEMVQWSMATSFQQLSLDRIHGMFTISSNFLLPLPPQINLPRLQRLCHVAPVKVISML